MADDTSMTETADKAISVPASYSQQRLWLSEQIDGSAARYNVQVGIRFLGELDRVALEGALGELVRNQPVLRTRLAMVDRVVTQVIAPHTPSHLEFTDLSGEPDPERALRDRAVATVRSSLDGSAVRFALHRLTHADHVLLITMDHLAADPWSVGVLHDELSHRYACWVDAAEPRPDPPIQYADYALWQHERLAAGDLDAQLAYWREQLGGDTPRLALPTTGTRRSRRAASLTCELPPALVDAVRALGVATGSSLFMTLFTGYSALLSRYASQQDVLISTLLSGRTRPETADIVGFFANLVVLRVDLSGQPSFRELLRRVKEVTLGAYTNQDIPFQHVIDAVRPERGGAETPLSNVLFQLADLRREPVETPETRIESYRAASQPTPVDLAVTVMLENDRTAVVCEYDTGLFEDGVLERMMEHYVRLLESMTTDVDLRIGDHELLTEADRRWLAARQSPAPPVRADWNVGAWFHGLAERFGANVAVDAGDVTLTYKQLDEASNHIANELRARGIARGTVVGLLLERGVDLVTCVLGVLKAGAAYLPLDPAYPTDRLRYMIEDAGPALVIGSGRADDLVPAAIGQVRTDELAGTAPSAPESTTTADDLAYVIYTSGSTGRPKGASIRHRGLAVFSDALRTVYKLTSQDRVLQLASPSFDASVWEMLWAYGVGATLCVPSAQAASYGDLADLVTVHRATAIITPPAVLAAVGADHDLASLRVLVAGGEACPPQLAARWSAGRAFYNAYGPTEASVWSTVHAVTDDDLRGDKVPIGRPIPGVSVEVLDDNHRRVPIGLPGELYVGGPSVGCGYLRRPALTAERFVPDPYSGEPGMRLYRTGDLVRWRHDGVLEFLGRIDRQVKLRGFRIELGEIEARLATHPGVREAMVVRREDTHGLPILAAYVVPDGDAAADAAELREYCGRMLPAHMVPAAVVALRQFPISPNGKVDTQALPEPDIIPVDTYVPPKAGTEQRVAAVWQEILGRPKVSATADFFDCGGDSLAATRVVARLRKDFQVNITARALFEHPTLSEFSDALIELVEGA